MMYKIINIPIYLFTYKKTQTWIIFATKWFVREKKVEEEEERILAWFGMDEEAFDVTEATRKQTHCFPNGKRN